MPKAFPLEFRRDVVAVARKNEAPIALVAKGIKIASSFLHNATRTMFESEGFEYLRPLGTKKALMRKTVAST